ncbi:hypothetical protein K7432_001791 [Basidiobolus ranarum]|uniref:Uncharacterized protein n=1 Tax=Basidiobolus ranarum TaxID=34480 RepID=A0ABR2W8W8_9FUNG
MPSEITLPPPALSFKKAPHGYLTSLISLSTYELEKDTKLDVSNRPFNHSDAVSSAHVQTLTPKEAKPYTFKQLFSSFRFFATSTEEEKLSSEDMFDEFEKEGQTMHNDLLHMALNADLHEQRPGYSPVKSAYIMSLEKLRNCKERPMVQVLLIHQTMSKLQCSVTVDGLHPSLIERRVIEKAAFLKRVGKATYSQIAPVPTPVTPKLQYIPPPPPYSRFESRITGANGLEEEKDDDDDDDVPLGLLQTYFQNRQISH